MELWYLITLTGTPQFWAVVNLLILFIYFLIRRKHPRGSPGRAGFKRFLFIFTLSLWLSFGLVLMMKPLIGIERPCIPCMEGVQDCNEYCNFWGLDYYSLPSGHAATSFAVFFSLFWVLGKRKYLPILVIPILISLSRVFLGVHTVYDIFAGSVMGILLVILSDFLYRRLGIGLKVGKTLKRGSK